MNHGELPGRLPLLAAGVLTINLLAAGGIAFPGVAASLWLLLALGVHLTGADAPSHVLKGRSVARAACGAAAVFGAFSWSDYLPVMQSRLLMLQSESAVGGSREETLRSAAEADPRWVRPWEALEAMELSRWRGRHDRTAFERWERALEEVNRRRPHSAAARLHAGNAYLDAYQVAHREHDLLQALANYGTGRAAVSQPRREPCPAGRGAGRRRQAAGIASEPPPRLRLDELSPHEDQKLSQELHKAVERLQEPERSASDALTARVAASDAGAACRSGSWPRSPALQIPPRAPKLKLAGRAIEPPAYFRCKPPTSP